jgi:hypothetical protein
MGCCSSQAAKQPGTFDPAIKDGLLTAGSAR